MITQEAIKSYALTYSLEDLKEMLAEEERHLERVKSEREDVGKYWTEAKIECWYNEIDRDIKAIKLQIEVYHQAITYHEEHTCNKRSKNKFNILCASCNGIDKKCSL